MWYLLYHGGGRITNPRMSMFQSLEPENMLGYTAKEKGTNVAGGIKVVNHMTFKLRDYLVLFGLSQHKRALKSGNGSFCCGTAG